ncbi:MAG: hypothetical protein AAFP70_00190 [Calditrichota bacterium]
MIEKSSWQFSSDALDTSVTRYTLYENNTPLSFRSWINGLQQSDSARASFIDVLKASSYRGYFWEVKPVTTASLNDPFEFVLVESNTLPQLTTDTRTFQKFFNDGNTVKAFANLGGDAQLIVPAQIGDSKYYAHLADFVRYAPDNQVQQFWQVAAAEYEKLIGDDVKWLSTSGLGVYWLHVRIDSRPKYYQFRPYKAGSGLQM